MIVGLLAAAAVLCACGLFALGFGLRDMAFSWGGTMIQAGVTLLGSGIVVVAMAMVATELRKLSDTLQGKRPAAASNRPRPLNIPEGLFPEQPSSAAAAPAAAAAAADPSAAAAPQVSSQALAVDGVAPPLAAGAAPRAPFVPEPIPELRSFDSAWPGPAGGAPPAVAASAVNPMLSPAAPTAPAPEAGPQRRSDLFRRSARASSLSGNPPADDAAARSAAKSEPAPAPPAAASPAQPAVTVLKSGVVDGMGYTLYSDGSIEAELADGKVTFASIEALRAHLDHRGST